MKIDIDEYKQGLYKSTGGLIRVFLREDAGCISDIIFTGDFFIFPDEALELMAKSLKGVRLDNKSIKDVVEGVFRREGVDSPGTTPADFAEAVMDAIR